MKVLLLLMMTTKHISKKRTTSDMKVWSRMLASMMSVMEKPMNYVKSHKEFEWNIIFPAEFFS